MPGWAARRGGERPTTGPAHKESAMSTERDTILEVQGMTCPSCIRHVTAALNEVDGVEKVDVKLRDGLVIVKHDAAQTPVATMIEKLENEGYVSKQRV
jgi:copper chaperone